MGGRDQGFCFRFQACNVACDALEGVAVNNRPHVGAQLRGVAHAQLHGGALDHLDHVVGNGLVHTQQAQRCPALRKAESMTASTTCSGKAVLSTTMALMPPVSAISGTMAPSLAAKA